MTKITRLLCANRSEIAIRVFRSAHELGIRTVALYTYEDRYALHRFKADEAYLLGKRHEPIRAYLDIERIVSLAQKHGIDGLHPGYGFLSENPQFARACERAGIVFVGPRVDILERLGDKTTARQIAREVGVPVLPGSSHPLRTRAEGERAAQKLGYPVILKATKGGGGRGMRIVTDPPQFAAAFDQAQREAETAFGSQEVFVEKLVTRASHVEVQLLGDQHGNLVHLFERDCSIQRRHQKVVEIAPAPALEPDLRKQLCDAALSIGRAVRYENAGTVEFLVDRDTGEFFFIEVNPRIQVEHTVTEEVTGIDLIKAQILIAQGVPLTDPEIGLGSQASVTTTGYALQCRVTTEDPSRNFTPDYGRIAHYRSASGMGIRLDAGTAFSGAVVNPFYDSLLVKVTARGRRFIDAARRMERCLQEFRVRGVKTNLQFLIRLVTHPTFLKGEATTSFIDDTPELFAMPERRDRATRLLTFLGETVVNKNPLVKDRPAVARREPAPVPELDHAQPVPDGTRQKLHQLGPERFAEWILKQRALLITDTTFRDAHQSLLATRMRTRDMVNIAEAYARLLPGLFSIEMWGGATFDTALRFLKECPWQRLAELRQEIPNILFQMLLRASNAVGYTNYPDNVVKAFVREAAEAGIDLFRVFDALNWTANMRVAMDAVLQTGALCEAAICYTGDILDPARTKYNLKYYVSLAKELQRMGAHILGIKDMAGLCKPPAAELLVKTLKQEVGIPVHFHTHDTAGIQTASILKAADVKLDIADAAMAPLSGGTSQVNLNTLVESLRFTPRDTGLAREALDAIAEYWRAARQFYAPFESEAMPATSDLYRHEMPGGQYTNLYQQAKALGLAENWLEVCRMYAEVNQLFGDIVKVTPTSKAVGDMALFMVANGLSPQDVLEGKRELAFPESVIDLMSGGMGQPHGGFPKAIRARILRGRKPFRGRPGATLPPADFEKAKAEVQRIMQREPSKRDVVTFLLYPKVFQEFWRHQHTYLDTSTLPTSVFFQGLDVGEEITVEIEPGKTLIVSLLTVGDVTSEGRRTVFFELNGQPRDVTVVDRAQTPRIAQRAKADTTKPGHVGSPMPGMVVNVAVQPGDSVAKDQKLLSLEAMKMETTIFAPRDGKVTQALVKPGTQVETGDLVVVIE
ncbi:MAG: pyruvate carboxylase [Planctomycetia bacterium]|nr:pyruvate carboxylase [Planctomycetia bacterium]